MPRRPNQLQPEETPNHRLASELRKLRRQAGEPTEAALAKKMGCSAATVSRMLNGTSLPSEENVVRFASACGVPPDQLLRLWRSIGESDSLDSEVAAGRSKSNSREEPTLFSEYLEFQLKETELYIQAFNNNPMSVVAAHLANHPEDFEKVLSSLVRVESVQNERARDIFIALAERGYLNLDPDEVRLLMARLLETALSGETPVKEAGSAPRHPILGSTAEISGPSRGQRIIDDMTNTNVGNE